MTTFRLQRVLDLRKRAEEAARQQLGAATIARLAAEEEMRRRLHEEQRLREEVAALLTGGRVDAHRVQGLGLLLDAAARAIHEQEAAVSRCAAHEKEARVRLTAAMSSRKAMDKLREHFEERVRAEEKRREAVMLGEIANARAAREEPARRAFTARRAGGQDRAME